MSKENRTKKNDTKDLSCYCYTFLNSTEVRARNLSWQTEKLKIWQLHPDAMCILTKSVIYRHLLSFTLIILGFCICQLFFLFFQNKWFMFWWFELLQTVEGSTWHLDDAARCWARFLLREPFTYVFLFSFGPFQDFYLLISQNSTS